jgi:CDP-diacylglycerol pyrophosphatase
VHISCVKPEVQKQMQASLKRLPKRWKPLDEKILGHSYYARLISEEDLLKKNAFKMMTDEIPEAKEHLGEFGLGMLVVKDKKHKPQYVLLASQKNGVTQFGSVEEIQNHDCPQLKSTK